MNDMPNDVNVNQGKSGSKLWLFGGLGCLLVLLLCAGGIGITAYFGTGAMKDIMQEMTSIEGDLMNSQEVIDAVGSPVKVTPGGTTNSKINGVDYLIIKGTVSGPQGEGTYEAKFTVEGLEGIELESLTVDAGGNLINVSEDQELDLGIELGE